MKIGFKAVVIGLPTIKVKICRLTQANGYNHPPTQIPPMHLLPGLAGQQAAAAAAVAAHAALFSPSGLPLPPGHPRDCRTTPLQGLDAVAAR